MEGVKKKKLLRAISLSSLRSLFLRLSFSLSSFPITLSPAPDHSPAFFVASSLLLCIFLSPSPYLALSCSVSSCLSLSVSSSRLSFAADQFTNSRLARLSILNPRFVSQLSHFVSLSLLSRISFFANHIYDHPRSFHALSIESTFWVK